jgi:hypothetical protein
MGKVLYLDSFKKQQQKENFKKNERFLNQEEAINRIKVSLNNIDILFEKLKDCNRELEKSKRERTKLLYEE